MKKRVFLMVFVFALAALACGESSSSRPVGSSKPQPTKVKWFTGGTLHQATSKQWMVGTGRNRLATAADWAYAGIKKWKGEAAVDEPDELEFGLKPYAQDLVTCVTGSAKTSVENGLEMQKVYELAAACAVLMEWHDH